MSSDKVQAVANYLLLLGNTNNKPISNKKMQKLLYYTQAWHVVFNPDHKALFKDDFEAWIHGPAIPSIYRLYKKFLHNSITDKPNVQLINEQLTSGEKSLIDSIWDVYSKYDADYLELLTHSEEPWQKARESISAHQSSSAIISIDSMLKYYGEKAKAN